MNKTKIIEIEVPEGKRAEWVNGVLTLIDEKPKDITERVKTFQDALDELGADDELVKEYRALGDNARHDTLRWLRLGIIVKALNEGWTPKFDKKEYRYAPYFYLYTEDEINEMTDEEKSRVVCRSYSLAGAGGGVAYALASGASSGAYASFGSRLALRTRELAIYAGKQFAEEYAGLILNESVTRKK